MILKFSKMQGLGNDFVVIDAVTANIRLTAAKIRKLCDRHFGIGCDQLLILEPPKRGDDDFFYRIYNADGSEAGHCGNGARCIGHFAHHAGLTTKPVLQMSTETSRFSWETISKHQAKVDMGAPKLGADAVDFSGPHQGNLIEIDGELYPVVSMGNPHIVLDVDKLDQIDIEPIAQRIQSMPQFKHSVNVGFMQRIEPGRIKLRVYERGAGETLACGTGACAAVVAGIEAGKLDSQVKVLLKGGELNIEWRGGAHPVMMTGPATKVFHGQIRI
jgi:diaminopimelate epimerase